MSKVAIVTDSTAYIPEESMAGLDIFVAPQILIWGDKTYEDGVDITPTEFYKRLATATVMPTTSQVSPQKFLTIFKQLLDQDYQILSVLISEKLSGTINSAKQAKETLNGAPIEIWILHHCYGDGFYRPGHRPGSQGWRQPGGVHRPRGERPPEYRRGVCGRYAGIFIPGGWIGGASRLLGSALGIKPILEIRDGVVEPADRVRTVKNRWLAPWS